MNEKFYLLGLKERQSKKTKKIYNIATILIDNPYKSTLKEVIIDDNQVKELSKICPDLNDISSLISSKYNSYSNQFEMSFNIN